MGAIIFIVILGIFVFMALDKVYKLEEQFEVLEKRIEDLEKKRK